MNSQILRQVSLFTSLEADELDELAQHLHPVNIEGGQVLFRDGDPGDRFYIIIEGQLAVTKLLETGEEVQLSVRGADDYVGEMSMFEPDGRRTATVKALTSTRLLELSHTDLNHLLLHKPSLALYLIRELSLRLRNADSASIRMLEEKNRQLTQAYNELKAAQAQLVEKEKLERELQVARHIQESMLPRSLPAIPGYTVGARMFPARAVGGDLFDFVTLDHGRLGIVIGDVSDKGVPAALFMALCRSLLRAVAVPSLPPSSVLRQVNQYLLDMNQAGMFITLIYGVLDCREHTFSYARAGHEMPLLFDNLGRPKPVIMGQGMLLGVFPDITLDEQVITIPAGGVLILNTDGATDALNDAGERFGTERFHQIIQASLDKPAQDLCNHVVMKIQNYYGETPPADDITIVAIHG